MKGESRRRSDTPLSCWADTQEAKTMGRQLNNLLYTSSERFCAISNACSSCFPSERLVASRLGEDRECSFVSACKTLILNLHGENSHA